MHTQVENPGEGVAQVFAKNPGGGGRVKDFRKNCQDGSPISGFLSFFFSMSLAVRLATNY
jgi:hypothetical protein